MLLMIDNYDSFTYNLVHLFGDLGAQCEVRRNDTLSVEDVFGIRPEAIVLSPGPGTPDGAGICLDLIRAAAGRIPILGICLGHQVIGQAFGARVVRADQPMHGKVSRIRHDGTYIFDGIPNAFEATRYHSLIVSKEGMPDKLEAIAHTEDGIMMALRHRGLPVFGVQFHPESIASRHGREIVGNFLAIARRANVPA
jgi:anthranilate synthase/aminodeoxychorismate synthase-like glutamine amidotransferase